MRIAFIAFVSLLALAAAAPAPTRSPAAMALAIDEAEALIAKGIDEARAEFAPEAPKLVRNGELDRIARLRSEAIAKGVDPFAHEDAKGRPAATDMMQDRVSPYGAFGENIMYDFQSSGVFNPERFAKTAVDGWMNSPGHRANILSPDYDRSGIGVAINPRGTTAYATQVFMGPARPAPRPVPARRPGPWQPQLQ